MAAPAPSLFEVLFCFPAIPGLGLFQLAAVNGNGVFVYRVLVMGLAVLLSQ
jgi:hypothetical protein